MTSTHYEIIVKGRKTGAILTYNQFGTLHSISRVEGIELGEWDSFLKYLIPKNLDRMNMNECDWVAFRELPKEEVITMLVKPI